MVKKSKKTKASKKGKTSGKSKTGAKSKSLRKIKSTKIRKASKKAKPASKKGTSRRTAKTSSRSLSLLDKRSKGKSQPETSQGLLPLTNESNTLNLQSNQGTLSSSEEGLDTDLPKSDDPTH